MIPALLDAKGIAARIPHAGPMALLEHLHEWDQDSILCSTMSHQREGHPLHTRNGLPATAGIEFAAQAMALHGGLIAELAQAQSSESNQSTQAPQPGLLASVRNVQVHQPRLDTLHGVLWVHANRIAAQGDHVLYQFNVYTENKPVIEGRAAVVLVAKLAP